MDAVDLYPVQQMNANFILMQQVKEHVGQLIVYCKEASGAQNVIEN